MAVSRTWRGLVSLLLFSTGITSAITGVVLFVVPEGRVAYWTFWDLIGISKNGWASIHTGSSLVLLIFGVFHVLNNWKPISSYMINKKTGGLNQTRNLITALVIALLIIVTGIFALPPAQWLMDLGDYVKGTWVTAPEYEPPFGHAEELSLAGFCRRMYIDVDAAKQELESAGLTVESKQQTLEAIARANSARPMDVYMVIKHLENAPQIESGHAVSIAELEDRFGPGSGAGRNTVKEIATMLKLDPALALERLAAAGVEAEAGSLLKDLKDSSDRFDTALEVVLIMLNRAKAVQ